MVGHHSFKCQERRTPSSERLLRTLCTAFLLLGHPRSRGRSCKMTETFNFWSSVVRSKKISFSLKEEKITHKPFQKRTFSWIWVFAFKLKFQQVCYRTGRRMILFDKVQGFLYWTLKTWANSFWFVIEMKEGLLFCSKQGFSICRALPFCGSTSYLFVLKASVYPVNPLC